MLGKVIPLTLAALAVVMTAKAFMPSPAEKVFTTPVIEVPGGTLTPYEPIAAPTVPNQWEILASGNGLQVEIDPSSLVVTPGKGGYEVTSMFKVQFFKEIEVKGKTKKGWYYVNKMTALCKDMTMRVDESSVYTKEGEKLMSGKNLGILRNQQDPNTFVTVWTTLACDGLRNKKVPRII